MQYTVLKQLFKHIFHKYTKTLSCMHYKGLIEMTLTYTI